LANKHASKKLKLFAWLWISFPFLYLAICLSFFELDFGGVLKIVLSPWYWFVSVTAVAAGLGLLQIRWYGWYLFLFSSFTTIYQTAIALTYYSSAENKFPVFAVYAVFQLLLVYLIAREVRVPYYFPRIRWWESDPRYKLSIPTRIEKNAEIYNGDIMDLSMSGCFIKTREYFLPDDSVTLEFSLFEKTISCAGKVVWRTESTVTHPKGIGVKFSVLDRDTSTALKQATHKLRKLIQEHNNKTREKNWEEYLAREKQYQSRTKVPKK